MATNFPGPYQIDLHYTGDHNGVVIEHVAKYNVNCVAPIAPGMDMSDIEVVTKGGTFVNAVTAILAWVDLLTPLFSEDVTFTYAEMWSVAPETFDRTFITTLDVSEAGTLVAPLIRAAQVIYTFRTQEGGIMRINLMETSDVPNPPFSFPTGFPLHDAVANFVISDSNWILARDTSYPIASHRLLIGQNEALFKKRFSRN